VERPETRYASVGDTQVAYQVFGDAPDLVHVQGFVSNVDYRWDEPRQARFLERLASFRSMRWPNGRLWSRGRTAVGAGDMPPAAP
jgi:hypothetical protein